jgi:hypothetical protein
VPGGHSRPLAQQRNMAAGFYLGPSSGLKLVTT